MASRDTALVFISLSSPQFTLGTCLPAEMSGQSPKRRCLTSRFSGGARAPSAATACYLAWPSAKKDPLRLQSIISHAIVLTGPFVIFRRIKGQQNGGLTDWKPLHVLELPPDGS